MANPTENDLEMKYHSRHWAETDLKGKRQGQQVQGVVTSKAQDLELVEVLDTLAVKEYLDSRGTSRGWVQAAPCARLAVEEQGLQIGVIKQGEGVPKAIDVINFPQQFDMLSLHSRSLMSF